MTQLHPKDVSASDRRFARVLWHTVETIHAVTYFAEESTQASAAAGVRGFWRTYFGFRAAPLGACSSAVVTATFFGFSPDMVDRAIPAAWALLTPEAYLDLRAASAAKALRRLVPSIDNQMSECRTIDLLDSVNSSTGSAGRSLFAGNVAVGRRVDRVERLWQTCTTMREFRGDGHIAALTTAGLVAPEALCLFAADNRMPLAVFEQSRGWSADDLKVARARLEDRGLIDGTGATAAGRRLRQDVERTTDELAAASSYHLNLTQRETLIATLNPIALTIAASGLIPYPNPIGLPDVSHRFPSDLDTGPADRTAQPAA